MLHEMLWVFAIAIIPGGIVGRVMRFHPALKGLLWGAVIAEGIIIVPAILLVVVGSIIMPIVFLPMGFLVPGLIVASHVVLFVPTYIAIAISYGLFRFLELRRAAENEVTPSVTS